MKKKKDKWIRKTIYLDDECIRILDECKAKTGWSYSAIVRWIIKTADPNTILEPETKNKKTKDK